jgi:SpoVK/Ycf46/Vps4 family AAA+-type ATPase
LEEMSGSGGTSRGDVVWFAATNRIDLVDPALRRPGRFDRIVPILPPDAADRWSILETKLSTLQASEQEQEKILQLTHRYTGADLDGVMIKATEVALDRVDAGGGDSQVTTADLLHALAMLKPSHDIQATDEMIRIALEYCNDLSLIPLSWRERASVA